MLSYIKEWLDYLWYMTINLAVCVIILNIFAYIGMVFKSLDYNQVTTHLSKVGHHIGDACDYASDAFRKRIKEEL